MSAPRQVNDGDFSVARQNGATEWEFPFAHEGDGTAWVATMTMRQDQANFRPLPPMSRIRTVRGIGYLVSAEDAKDINQGRVEWTRVVANVPKTRTVPGGIANLALQFLATVTSVTNNATPPAPPSYISVTTYEAEEIPIPRPTELTYEYSTTPFAVIAAPRIVTYNKGLNYVLLGNWSNYAMGQMILVQDSELSLYRGLIYCRMTQRASFPATLTT